MIRAVSMVFIFLVRGYQLLISPWLGSNCRHQPTCSAYTIEALREWGPIKGGVAWNSAHLQVSSMGSVWPRPCAIETQEA